MWRSPEAHNFSLCNIFLMNHEDLRTSRHDEELLEHGQNFSLFIGSVSLDQDVYD